jgi:TonB-linked SusC/RagA family outer membrane protein
MKKLFFIGKNIATLGKQMKIATLCALFLIAGTGAAVARPEMQQSKTRVAGTVVDRTGEPVIGANIVEKGDAANGTITDADGKFSLQVNAGATLTVSYIGYVAQEVAVGSRTQLQITLQEDTQALDEVVVVGFGTQKKVNLTGSVSVADAKVFKERPVATASQALQGMVPGLLVTQFEGGPSYNPTIQIRGMGTVGKGSSAGVLVLIDGMEGDINTINPQDIESVSVLKDAAASSIYGSRAPFGVMLITTKRGKTGKPTLNYNNSFRWNTPVHLPEPVDSYTFALYLNDVSKNSSRSNLISDEHLQRIQDYQAGRISTVNIPDPNNPQIWATGKLYANANENWIENTYNSWVLSQEHNLSLNGGTDKYRYYTSLQFMDFNGLLKYNTDRKQRYSGSAKLDIQATEWAQINTSVRFIREDMSQPYYMPNMQEIVMNGWAILPMYDDNGYLTTYGSNLLRIRDGGNKTGQNDAIYLQEQIVLEPVKNWKTFGEFNYRSNYDQTHSEWHKVYNHNSVNGEQALEIPENGVGEVFAKNNFMNVNLYSEYTRSTGDHTLKGMVGFQSELMKTRYMGASRIGIMVPSLPEIDLTNGFDPSGNQVTPGVEGKHNHWATAGYFGRLNWDYRQKYLLEGNLRYDGSSRFRRDNRWIWLPSVSAGWNVAFEDFWEPYRDYLGSFKLRASYGDLANQNTDSWYPTYVTLTTGTSSGAWLINGAKPNTAGVPGLISSTLTWERIRTVNTGFDFGALNNRLTGSFDYFTRYTLDMVGPGMSLPQVLGTSVPNTNNTDMKSYGFDLAVTWNDRLKNGLGYGVELKLSDAVSQITRYPGNPQGYLDDGTGINYSDGWIVGDLYGYKTKGIAKTQAEMDAHLATLPNGGQNQLGNSWQAGDLMFVDVNGDGIINGGTRTKTDPGDLVKVGNATPRYSFGLNLFADYKGFDIRAFFQGILKRQVYIDGYNMFSIMYQSNNYIVVYDSHLDYFRDDPDSPLGLNTDSYFGRPYFDRYNNFAETASGSRLKMIDRFIQDASYLRLKNLQIGYTLPSFTQKVAVRDIRFYLSGENLFTLTKLFKEFDPEMVDYRQLRDDGTRNPYSNAQGFGYPMMKVISIGCSINF